MNKTDQLFLKHSLVIIIVSAVFYNLTLEHLLQHGYSSPSVLVYRGIITFSLTVVLSIKGKQPILPANISHQLIRVLVSGTALLMVFQSYKYLEASTVSMIARLDIPFAVLIGFILGNHKANFKVYLSVFSVLLVLSIFFFAKHIGESIDGLILALASILMISISYLLVKKATGEENNFVIVNTTNIGCITVGLISGLLFKNLNIFHLADLWIFLLASISQFLLNYTTCVLYRYRTVEYGQRPYLISVLVLLVAEQLWHGRIFDFHHSGIIVTIISVIFLITMDNLSVFTRFYKKTETARNEQSEDESFLID